MNWTQIWFNKQADIHTKAALSEEESSTARAANFGCTFIFFFSNLKFCFKSDGCTWCYACFLFAFDKFQVAKESKERNTMACHEPGEARKRKVDKEASVCATAGVAGTIPICFERRKRFGIIISFAFWCKFQSFYIIPAFAKFYFN